jgi:predicted RNA-binding protein with PIN domain
MLACPNENRAGWSKLRWLIDGMNLIGARPDGWWNDPDRAMRTLAKRLEDYAAETGDEVTVVFDRKPASLDPHQRVLVVVARWKGRNAADHEIEVMVGDDDDPGGLRVVTSDRRLSEKIRALGAKAVSSGSFRARLDRTLR